MIYLITGTPGGGKSLRAVWYAEKFLSEGRAVFGNINGYGRQSPIPGMSPLIKEASGRWSGGVGGDWRETPDGSVVIYDEAQRDFPQRANSAPVPPLIRAMETHRHTGHDILIVTQHPNQVDHWMRRLVGKHDHLRRLGGMGRVALVSADSVMELPQGVDSSAGEKSFWKYPKSLYSAYESATYHTVKHRLPQPVIFMIVLVLLAVIGGVWATYRFSSSGFSSSSTASSSSSSPSLVSANSSSSTSAEPNLTANRLLSQQPLELRPLLPVTQYIQEVKPQKSVMGCAMSASACRCWDTSGAPLLISDRLCVAFIQNVLPFNLRSVNQRDSPKDS